MQHSFRRSSLNKFYLCNKIIVLVLFVKMKFYTKIVKITLMISILYLVLINQSANATNSSSETGAHQDDLELKKSTTFARVGRAGRMLDLDVLAGDLGKDEKDAKERSLSGNRQSRILTEDIGLNDKESSKVEGRSSKKNGGKKMSIKGFIPIVSLDGKHNLEDLDANSDSDDSSESQETGNQEEQQNNLRNHLQNSYGGQTSIGHASFMPSSTNMNQQQQQQQQQSNNQEIQWQHYGQPQDQSSQQEAGRANRKLLGSSNILSGLTGGAKRGLISSLVPSPFSQSNDYSSSYSNQQQQQQHRFQQPHLDQLSSPMNLPQVFQTSPSNLIGSTTDSSSGGECICVPFFQCKNGYLSESQLSKSQLAHISQFPSGSSAQIPRSLSGFKLPSSPQATDLYNNYNTQLQSQSQTQTPVPVQVQINQHNSDQQQQQIVNDMIYDQLRKNIESSNMEQQLQQQEAYNSANQQHLSLIDERNAGANSSSIGDIVEGRSLLNPLSIKRQYQSQPNKCGIMRTCCRFPTTKATRHVGPVSGQPLINSASRFINQYSQLVASPSISRPQNQYQLMQPQRQGQLFQQNTLVAPESIMNEFNYNQQAQKQRLLDSYQLQQQQQQQVMQAAQSQIQQQAPSQAPAGSSFMQGRCGMRQTLGISGRVQNSDNQPGVESSAEFGEFPAHAAILKRLSPGDSLFVCSAVLISNQWLATAAHCVRKSRVDELKVRLGEWDVNRDDEFYPFFESNVREIVVQPDFQATSLINDIALIRLEQPVDSQQMPHIAPACLATPADGLDQSFQFNGQRCWVAGWGKNAFGQQGTFQSVLKKVDLPVVSRPECELALKYQTKLGKHFRLHSSNICAGGERGKDACEGDGGAGLYCVEPTSGLSKAVGLVSWGVGCGQRGVPGVYVSLAHFNSWIESVVASSGEENVYMDARIGGELSAQAFKNIISERSNHNVNATLTPQTNLTTTTTALPVTMIDETEARQANVTEIKPSTS